MSIPFSQHNTLRKTPNSVRLISIAERPLTDKTVHADLSARQAGTRPLAPPIDQAAASALALQGAAGNRAVTRLVRDARETTRPSHRVLHRSAAAVLMEAGAGLLAADAEASPVEVAAGPPGWVVAGAAALVGASLLGIGYAMSSGGRPSNNTDQNKQFADAVREIERRIGRRLSKDEIRQLHEALHGEENPGYHEIVDLGLSMFGGGSGSSDDSSGGTGGGSSDVGSGSGSSDDSSGGSGS